jgi:hypothetical protein
VEAIRRRAFEDVLRAEEAHLTQVPALVRELRTELCGGDSSSDPK